MNDYIVTIEDNGKGDIYVTPPEEEDYKTRNYQYYLAPRDDLLCLAYTNAIAALLMVVFGAYFFTMLQITARELEQQVALMYLIQHS